MVLSDWKPFSRQAGGIREKAGFNRQFIEGVPLVGKKEEKNENNLHKWFKGALHEQRQRRSS